MVIVLQGITEGTEAGGGALVSNENFFKDFKG